jgi:4-hydroxybenzoate polyprenyltransferase
MLEAHPEGPRIRAATLLERWLGLVRVRQWVHLLPLPVAGYDFGRSPWANLTPMSRGLAVTFCVLAFGYLLNAVADRDMDLDRRKNPLSEAGNNADRFLLPLLLLAGLALALAATGSAWVVACAAVSLLSGTLYSVGPRLKAVPYVGTFTNLTNFVPLLFVGSLHPLTSPRLLTLAACFGALLLQNQLIHEAADAPEDRHGGLQTTFLRAGARGTAILAMLCGAVALAATVWAMQQGVLPAWMAPHALPYVVIFPALVYLRGDSPAQMRTTRTWQRWCAAASGALLFMGLR